MLRAHEQCATDMGVPATSPLIVYGTESPAGKAVPCSASSRAVPRTPGTAPSEIRTAPEPVAVVVSEDRLVGAGVLRRGALSTAVQLSKVGRPSKLEFTLHCSIHAKDAQQTVQTGGST